MAKWLRVSIAVLFLKMAYYFPSDCLHRDRSLQLSVTLSLGHLATSSVTYEQCKHTHKHTQIHTNKFKYEALENVSLLRLSSVFMRAKIQS